MKDREIMIQIVNRDAVRITHLPTGISATAAGQPTLPGNKSVALKQLKGLLRERGQA